MSNSVNVSPSIKHSLCAAWQFTDAFSGRPISVPLHVTVPTIAPAYSSMPALPWSAVDADDGAYRFQVANATIAPTGTLAVNVTVPTLDYASFEPLSMTLPRTLAAPPYPQRSDYLINANLWPTRLFAVPPGETAVVGTITSASSAPVAGLRVTMWSSVHASAPPGAPYTYTDRNGDFLFRLLGSDFRVNVAGGVVTTTANVSIGLLTPPAYTTALAAAFSPGIALGQVNFVPISVP